MAFAGATTRTTLEYPSDLKDYKGMVAYADRVIDDSRGYRYARSRTDLRNIFFYRGIQWITYDDGLKTYRPVGFSKTTPRPVTNIIAPLVNHTCSRLVNFKPPISVSPTGVEADDVVAALVGDKVVNVIEREINVRALRPVAAKWLGLTGDVFLIQNYDTSPESGLTFVHFERCTVCGVVSSPLEIEDNADLCPECEASEFEPAVEPNGAAIGEYVPRGRHATEVKPFFNCYFDLEAGAIEDSEYFAVQESMSLEWVARTYGEEAIKDLATETYRDYNQWYIEAAAFAVSGTSRLAWTGNVGGKTVDKVRVRRVWLKPHMKKAPTGLYFVILGANTVVEAKPWPYHDENGNPFLNVIHIKFDDVSGSCVGRTRVDDLAPRQELRNYLEAIQYVHARRMTNAIWMLPYGMGMSRTTGEGGLYVRYTPLAGAQPPRREPGLNPPPFILMWIQQIDKEADVIWGTYDVSRGEAPGGVPSYAALSLLDERAQQGQSALFENWAFGWLEVYKQHLNIWREYADADRTYAIGGGAWAVEKFNSAKLAGGIDISIDIGQFRPKSLASLRASLDLAMKSGLINVMDPQERFRSLTFLGLPELMEDYKLDWEQANRENDEFKQGGLIPPPMPWENAMVHVRIHRPAMLTDWFRALDPIRQGEFFQHVMMHLQSVAPPAPPGGSQAAVEGPAAGGPGGGPGGPEMGEEEMRSASQDQGMEL